MSSAQFTWRGIVVLAVVACFPLGFILSRAVRGRPTIEASQGKSMGASLVELQNARRPTLMELYELLGEDRAVKLEQMAVEAGYVLTDPPDPAVLPEWSSVSDAVRDRMLHYQQADARITKDIGWSNGTLTRGFLFDTPDINTSGRAVNAVHISALRSAVESFEWQLLSLSEELSVATEEALAAKWTAGEYEAVPFVYAPTVTRGSHRAHFIRSVMHRNWAVTLELREGDSPEYDRVAYELSRIRGERAAAARKLIEQF